MAKPLVFPHVPKCGGTSIRRALERSGLRCFFDYDHPPSHHPHFAEQCRLRNADFRLLDFSPFDVVYGHFPLERYTVPPEQVVLLIREPVERALSQYYYFRDLLPEAHAAALVRSPEILPIKRGEMGVVEFARAARLDTFYEQYLGRCDTSAFRLVGFTDRMPQFVSRLRDDLGIDLGEVGVERRHAERPRSADEHVLLRPLLAEDVDWYEAQRALARGEWRLIVARVDSRAPLTGHGVGAPAPRLDRATPGGSPGDCARPSAAWPCRPAAS